MWVEIEKAKLESRRELVLTGQDIRNRIEKDGLDMNLFALDKLNYLGIMEVALSGIPEQIQDLTNLQTLLLYSNNIETMNAEITKLHKLKVLDLSRNKIKQIPESIKELELLTTLNLNGNMLDSIPPFSNNTKLAALDLSNNNLKDFSPVCSKNLVNLSELKLSGNQIEEVPTSLRYLPLLKVLDLSSNNIKSLPKELAECTKLKDINLKSNPITDKRLRKLIDQNATTKQILDYVKQYCPKMAADEPGLDFKNQTGNRKKKVNGEAEKVVEDHVEYQYDINVKSPSMLSKVQISESVKNVRKHFVACIVNDVSFTEETFKLFISLQNKLHNTVCQKRNAATIATHDCNKLMPGNIIYTTAKPTELMLHPLDMRQPMTAACLFQELKLKADNLRKEKKRNTYSGIHKYLYLIEGKPEYPCVLNCKNEVISFPPITNSEISKIEVTTTRIFIECTSTVSVTICELVLDTLLKEMVFLFKRDLEVQQVRTTKMEVDKQVTLYPGTNNLIFDTTVPIRVRRPNSV